MGEFRTLSQINIQHSKSTSARLHTANTLCGEAGRTKSNPRLSAHRGSDCDWLGPSRRTDVDGRGRTWQDIDAGPCSHHTCAGLTRLNHPSAVGTSVPDETSRGQSHLYSLLSLPRFTASSNVPLRRPMPWQRTQVGVHESEADLYRCNSDVHHVFNCQFCVPPWSSTSPFTPTTATAVLDEPVDASNQRHSTRSFPLLHDKAVSAKPYID